MAHINLLPHRAARRKQREREFYLQLGVAFAASIAFLLLWGFWMGERIDNQNDRNSMLQNEIKQVDVRIAKIKDLESVRDHLLARKQVIEQLQADRAKMVHLFDELVRTIPASARLKSLKQEGGSMSLDGVAQSNASVAEYMRNIEASPWMGHTDLRKTEKSAEATRMPYTFGLDVALVTPKNDVALAAAPATMTKSPTTAPVPAAAPVAVPAPVAAPAATVAPAPAPAGSAGAAVPAVKPIAAPTGGKP